MFLKFGLTTGTGSTQVVDVPGSSREPSVQVILFGQQRDNDNQKGVQFTAIQVMRTMISPSK